MMSRLELETSSGHLSHKSADSRLAAAIEKAVSYLTSLQHEEGYWLGELAGDTTLESDYIFYLHVLGRLDDKRVAKLAEYVRRRQLEDGGWNIYFGGPSEINATVKAYFALKLAGHSPESKLMVRARNRALELGGLEQTNSFTRLYLALAGVIGWEMVPAIPPELMLLPQWAPINIYEMSSWTRAIVIPLTILYARKPSWPVPAQARLDELFTSPFGRGRHDSQRADVPGEGRNERQTLRPSPYPLFRLRPIGLALRVPKGEGWKQAFLTLDSILKLYERLPRKPGRERALRRSSEWMLEHLERSEGLAAIYPAMMNSIFALMCLGYSPDHPITARQIDEFSRFEIEEIDTLRVQPCVSPVWDTAIAAFSLLEANP